MGYRFCRQRRQVAMPARPSAHVRQPAPQATHWPARLREKPAAQMLQVIALSQTWQLSEHLVHALVVGLGK